MPDFTDAQRDALLTPGPRGDGPAGLLIQAMRRWTNVLEGLSWSADCFDYLVGGKNGWGANDWNWDYWAAQTACTLTERLPAAEDELAAALAACGLLPEPTDA
jgi:hypothetical protein